MSRIHGKNGSVLMDPTGGSTLVALADLNAWALNMGKDKVDVTAFGDTNKRKVLGLPDFSGTFGGFYNSATSPTLFDAILGSAEVALKLLPDTVEPTFFFAGAAFLDGNIAVDANGAVTVGGTFDAAGDWAWAP